MNENIGIKNAIYEESLKVQKVQETRDVFFKKTLFLNLVLKYLKVEMTYNLQKQPPEVLYEKRCS